MTRYEKVLLLLLLLFLLLNVAAVTGGFSLFFLGLWVLTISYLLGSYWLFDQDVIAVPIRLTAGVCFALAVISFNYTSGVELSTLLKLLPVANGLFSIGLGGYLLLHRREAAGPALRGLWFRSVMLLAVSGFFAYCPISFWPYRKALIALNHSRENIVSNIRMFDYWAEYDAAMDQKDYPAAVAYGQQALAMGKQWLGEDSVKLRWRISGTYTNLYTAYKSLGDAEYKQRQYQASLQAYQAGNAFLVTGDHRENGVEQVDKYWEEEKAWSLNNMAFCYLKLRRFTEGDSLFIGAIKAYQKVYPKPDLSSARLAGDVATSFTAQRQFDPSTKVLRDINRFLTKDTTQEAGNMRVKNILSISLNYMQQDSLPQALRLLQTMKYPPGDTTTNRYKAGLQQALCLYKMERYGTVQQALQLPLAYYRQHPPYWEAVALCEVLLAKNSLAQAAYPEARKHIEAAKKVLSTEKQGSLSSLNTSCLSVLGALNKALGNYSVADQQLTQAVAITRRNANDVSSTMPEILAQLADLDVTLGREAAAHEHIGEALAVLLQGKPIELPSQTGLLVSDAYVDYVQGHYQEASRKYRQAVAINTRYGQGYNGTAAAAWNGLGLIETAQHHYERADSVFVQAVRLHEKLFSERHPLTATVYLNYGLLRLKQSRNGDAKLFFEKADGIANAFLPADHDMFGDLAMAMGDLATQEKQAAVAHEYYQQALAIYTHKLPATHWKMKDAQRKAGA